MIKVIIRNLLGQETNSAQFDSNEEVDSWLSRHTEMGTWRLQDKIVSTGDGGLVEVFPKTHTCEIIDDYVDQDKLNQECRDYLASTDWYVVRAMEVGTQMPIEIAAARQAARTRII